MSITEGDQFSLCWNNFHSNLSSGFQSLFKDEDLVDVTLACDGRYLKAHKTVLSVCSPFFKQLFQANPHKHPIVILPEVSYGMLCSVLHFMYQGQVSVRQEDIPTFMRVAEMLKVKGLTDEITSNTSRTSNSSLETIDDNDSPYNLSTVDRNSTRHRPLKKSVRSVSNTSARTSHSVSPTVVTDSPAKKIRLDEQLEPQALVKPKEENIDLTLQGNDAIDPNSLLNLNSSEASKWSQFGEVKCDDNTPGAKTVGMVLLKSGRGQLVLVHNGHMYTHSQITREKRHEWVCVKKKTLNCDGCLTTVNGPILLSYSNHNHPQLNEVIQRLPLSGYTTPTMIPSTPDSF